MATNADEPVVDNDKSVTEDDLRALKYDNEGVEPPKGEDEPNESETPKDDTKGTSEEDGQTADQSEEASTVDEADKPASEEDTSQFVKELPNISGDTVEDYARSLEKAYQESTKEALRLKTELDSKAKPTDGEADDSEEELDTSNPINLFMKQKMDEEIKTAFEDFLTKYPQAGPGTPEYTQFTNTVAIVSRTILESEKRLPSPKESYAKAAAILGWTPANTVDDKDKLGIALKNNAAIPKTSSATKPTSRSKVTDEMMAANRRWYPDKSDAEIRKELEPHVT